MSFCCQLLSVFILQYATEHDENKSSMKNYWYGNLQNSSVAKATILCVSFCQIPPRQVSESFGLKGIETQMKNLVRTRLRAALTSSKPSSVPPARPSSKKDERVRLVIADDDPIILHQLASLLEIRFDVVARAENGVELVEAARKFSPELVVADITMPEMNGIEASRRILATQPKAKVVLVSGYMDDSLIAGAIEAGVSGYVVKLNAFTELVPAIEAVLSGETYWPSTVTRMPMKQRYASR
jgi:CheY-like chemotaxis protein